MVGGVLPVNGATQQNPVDPDDASSDSSAGGTVVVGLSSGDAGTGFVVGDPGLAASADSGDAAEIAAARANPLAPVGSSGGAGDLAGAAAPVAGSVAGGSVALANADSPASGGAAIAILDAGGVAPADAPPALDRVAAAGGRANTPALAPASAAPGGQAGVTDVSNAGQDASEAAGAAPSASLTSASTPSTGVGDTTSSTGSGGATTDTVSVPGSGLAFDNTFQASVTSQFENCIIEAETTLASLWTNPVTLNLDFTTENAGVGNFLGENSFSFVDVSYSQLTSALASLDQYTTFAQDAVAALPATDPIPDGSGDDWSLPEAYARMLGLSSSTSGFDSTITLNTSYDWDYSTDVIDTIEHEISEGSMGRVGGLGDQNDAWSTMDLFRYNSADEPDYTDGRDGLTTYFSYNGGTTLSLSAGLSFNNEYNSSGEKVNGGDVADFTELDVFGIGETGETDTLSPTDIEMMDVLGWDPDPTVVSSGFTVSAEQTSSGTTVLNSGTLMVASGGTVSLTTVSSGGLEIVSSGGTDISATIGSGGEQEVFGSASAVVVNGGFQVVEAGGNATLTTIGSSGSATVSSGGTLVSTTVAGGGTLDLTSGTVISGGLTLSGGSATLIIGGTPPTVPITGFTQRGDAIDLTSLAFSGNTSVGFDSATDVLTVTEGGGSATLELASASYTGISWVAQSDLASGTEVTAACFCRGTLILTEQGKVAIEDLAIGDKVMTCSGALRPIKWIGRRGYDGRFAATNPTVLPIRIAAGALADGVPARDLFVSPEHALYLDEVLVPARRLVNGATIVQVEKVEQVEYFHIELETHEVLFAEGAPAETFVDCDNRFMFHNAGEFAALYPDDVQSAWQFCASRAEAGSAALGAIHAALLERAEALGHRLERDPDLHLVVNGRAIWPESIEGDRYRFAIPAGSLAVSLASRSAVPAEIEAGAHDIRRLGVAIERIALFAAKRLLVARHDDAELRDGFHADEGTHRWTDGLARLPEAWLRSFPGGALLEVDLTRAELCYRVPPPTRSRDAAAAPIPIRHQTHSNSRAAVLQHEGG